MRMPAGTQSDVELLPFGGNDHVVTSLWARMVDESDPQSLRIWFFCYDGNGGVLDQATGGCPTNSYPYPAKEGGVVVPTTNECIRSLPGFLDTNWQKFQLFGSCPVGTEQLGIRVENTNGQGPDVLIDDLTVSITSLP